MTADLLRSINALDGEWVVSRPGNLTPAPRRTVRETLASHGSHQTNLPFNLNGWCSYSTTSSCFQLCPPYDCPTRSLRSNPITGPSSLLQIGPPQTIASVLSPRGCLPLCFSLSIDGLVPAVPHKSLCRTHALYTPAAPARSSGFWRTCPRRHDHPWFRQLLIR